MPSLTIGMPVYNGELYVARALNSLLAQDYSDWVMVVADNCSTDNTVAIVKDFCNTDSRIRLAQHPNNIGATNNFVYLTENIETPFFMWAAADDEWSPNYLSECLAILTSNHDVGFVGGGVLNIDVNNQVVRNYEPFSAFDSDNLNERLERYIKAREAGGKANMIYSVYRTPLVQSVCKIPHIFKGWGSDMAFVAAVLARAPYRQATKANLLKRIISDDDLKTAYTLNLDRYSEIQFQGHFPPIYYREYVEAICRGMPTIRLKLLSRAIMLWRQTSLYLKRKLNISI